MAAGSVPGRVVNVHRPILRWQSAQWTIVASAFFSNCLVTEIRRRPLRLKRCEGVDGPGVLARLDDMDETEGDREIEGVCGCSECAREWEGRSTGGLGGAMVHPKRAVITADSDGMGIGSLEPLDGAEATSATAVDKSSVGPLDTSTDDSVEVSAWIWDEVCKQLIKGKLRAV